MNTITRAIWIRFNFLKYELIDEFKKSIPFFPYLTKTLLYLPRDQGSSIADNCEHDTAFPRYCFTAWRTLSTHTRVDHAAQSVEHRLRLTTRKLGESGPKERRESREDWREKRVLLSSPAPLSRLNDFNVGSFSEMGRSRVYSIGRRPPLRNPLSSFSADSLSGNSDLPLARNIPRKSSGCGSPTNCLEKRRAMSKRTSVIFSTTRGVKRNWNILLLFAW